MASQTSPMTRCFAAGFRVSVVLWSFSCPSLRAGDAVRVLASYDARISERDHRNRGGKPLKTVAAILRRDRELGAPDRIGNWELEDNPCDFFNTAEHRSMMESLLEGGHIDASTAKAILNDTPLVKATLYSTADGKAIYLDVKLLQGGKPVVGETF